MSLIELKCHRCGSIFSREPKEINRQIKNGRKYFFCNLSCSSTYTQKTTHEINTNCLWCKKEFITTTHKKARACCSKQCASAYSQSFVNVNNISYSLKKYYIKNPKAKLELKNQCITCKREFSTKDKNKQTCSKKCYHELLREKSTSNPNCGGETNYRKYQYNGIWMDSKWEIEMAKHMDSNGIVWERNRKKHNFLWNDKNGIMRRYYPDFYLPKYNVYLDPKNKYLMVKDEYKINQVIKEHNIKLIWGLIDDVKSNLTDYLKNCSRNNK